MERGYSEAVQPFRRASGPVIGVLTFTLMFVVLMFWAIPWFVPGMLLKVAVPVPAFRQRCTAYLVWVAERWVGTNAWLYRRLQDVRWDYDLDPAIDLERSYLLVSNHQSWADILVLLDAFHRRAQFPRFFLKQELIWLPLIGLICWALDMPFMRRHSKAAIARDPSLRNADLETTRRFCERYRGTPVMVVNFLEGTRFSEQKRDQRGADFRNLLRPKSAGLAFTLNAMGDQFAGLIDVTVVYDRPRPGRSLLWGWLCGEQSRLRLVARVLPIPDEAFTGRYDSDEAFRSRFQAWVNQIWVAKDRQIERLKEL